MAKTTVSSGSSNTDVNGTDSVTYAPSVPTSDHPKGGGSVINR